MIRASKHILFSSCLFQVSAVWVRCTAETQSGNWMFPIQMGTFVHPYIPSSTATCWQKSDQVFKNSTKVTQPPPRKINLIWKNRFNFLLSRISSLVQLTADMWEFVTYHSLGAGTATWNGRGCIHNADLPALSWQRGGLQEVPQQPKVILVSLNKVTFPLTRLHKPHKNCWARWLPHLSFHGTVLTQYKCVRNKFWKKQGYFFRVSVGYNSFR